MFLRSILETVETRVCHTIEFTQPSQGDLYGKRRELFGVSINIMKQVTLE